MEEMGLRGRKLRGLVLIPNNGPDFRGRLGAENYSDRKGAKWKTHGNALRSVRVHR